MYIFNLPTTPHPICLPPSHVHKAGGLCIMDEVQTGFGRGGEYFWIFQSQGAYRHLKLIKDTTEVLLTNN